MTKKKNNRIKNVTILLAFDFLLLFSVIFIPIRIGTFFLLPTFLLFALGLVLIFEVKRSKLDKSQKRWFYIAGFCAAGIPASIVFHNFGSALFGFEEAVFFLFGLIVFPILLSASLVKSFIIFYKDRS